MAKKGLLLSISKILAGIPSTKLVAAYAIVCWQADGANLHGDKRGIVLRNRRKTNCLKAFLKRSQSARS